MAVLGILFHTAILTAFGSYLVQAGSPQKADVAVVLAGDPFGNRIIAGAELAQEGYVPKVLVRDRMAHTAITNAIWRSRSR